MTTITDNFNRANNATSLGSSSEGWSWTAVDGTWGIDSNAAIQSVQSQNNSARAEIDLATVNHYAQLTLASLTANLLVGGVCTRFAAAAKTFYCYVWRTSTTRYSLFKCVTGTFTLIGTGGAVKADGDVIKLESNSSNQHTGYRNGAVDLAAVTDTSITTGLRTGMVMNRDAGGQPTYDNFSAADLPSSASPIVRGISMISGGITLRSGLSPTLNKGLVKDELNTITRV